MYLTTEQVARITGANKTQITGYVRDRIMQPAVMGSRTRSHQWRATQVLAIGAGQVLRRLGLRGEPIHAAIKLIAGHTEGDLERVFEGRPVLLVIPGETVCCDLMARDAVQEHTAACLATYGTIPLGIDLERMHKRMLECIEQREKNNWRPVPADEGATVHD